jgi:hypothetical protein
MARIQTFDELLQHGGGVIKYKAPQGYDLCDGEWQYAKLGQHGHQRGIGGYNEVLPSGVHSSRDIQSWWFNAPGFVCETTTAEEIAGKVWSYDR